MSILTIVAYYVVGMPLALYFSFTVGMGVKGFWLGYMIIVIFLCISVVILVIFTDWSPKIAEEAKHKNLIDVQDESFQS